MKRVTETQTLRQVSGGKTFYISPQKEYVTTVVSQAERPRTFQSLQLRLPPLPSWVIRKR